MIREDLLEFQYYLNRLSMFMKESYGMKEHVEIFYQQLLQVNKEFDYLFEELDIFNVEDRHVDTNWISDLIDRIGSIFGCYRNFTIVNSDDEYEEINLNDEEFLYYIKCQVVKQNFQGTREELARIYKTYDDGKITENALIDMTMVYVIYQTDAPLLLNSVRCDIYWSNYNESKYTDNLRKLFLSGYLTVESMGILYNRILQNITGLGIFAALDTQKSDGDYYRFSPLVGDYYKVTADGKYYIYTENDTTGEWYWLQSSSIGSGYYRGEVATTGNLPAFIQGGFFA